jgi:hypothetical protein
MDFNERKTIIATRREVYIETLEELLEKMHSGWSLRANKTFRGVWVEEKPGYPGIKVRWSVVSEGVQAGHFKPQDSTEDKLTVLYTLTETKPAQVTVSSVSNGGFTVFVSSKPELDAVLELLEKIGSEEAYCFYCNEVTKPYYAWRNTCTSSYCMDKRSADKKML